MKIAVIGAGGIGGYFGALLARAGQDVSFLVRERNVAWLQKHGIEVRAGDEEFVVKVHATAEADEIDVADLVLLCVKTYDVERALPLLHPLVGSATRVLPLQNGVTAVDAVAATVGVDRTLGGVAYIEAALVEPGVVVKSGPMHRIVFGPLDGQVLDFDEVIRSTLHEAGIASDLSNDIRAAMWRKFVFICAMAGLTTLTGHSVGDVLAVPDTHELFVDAISEAVAVSRAMGVRLPDKVVEETTTFAEGLPPAMRSSMQKDLEEGRPLELDALNGTVVQLGRAHGIPVPINRTIFGALQVVSAG